ncbi:hypothetical protein R84B8_02303 [Treponema sp. R8-4-B8]
MKKKIFLTALVMLIILAGVVFAEDDVCNYYENGTAQIDARISFSTDKKTATIEIKSYVGKERIEVYKVVVDKHSFDTWDIKGTKVIGPHGLTSIIVTSDKPFGFGQNANAQTPFKVYLKTCP